MDYARQLISNRVITAVKEGDVATVKELIQRHGLSFSLAWSNGYNLLRDATMNNHTEISRFLLSSGCKVNSKASYFKPTSTPLHFSAAQNNAEIVQMLLEKGANVMAKDPKGQTPLHYAAESSSSVVVALLINGGAKVNYRNLYDNKTPLLCAATGGNYLAVELLLAKGARITDQCKDGKSALYMAVESNNLPLAELLLSKGASVNIKDNKGITPLHRAASRNLDVFADVLISKGASINEKNLEGKTALHLAVESFSSGTLLLLLSKGADVNTYDKTGKSPLHTAVSIGFHVAVEHILKHGASVKASLNSKSKDGLTPLDTALQLNMLDVVNLLLSSGAQVSGKLSETPLLLAVKTGTTELVEKALKGHPDKANRLPFLTALEGKNYEVVKKLLDYGFAVTVEDIKNSTIFANAIKNGHANIVEDLLKFGINPQAVLSETEERFTPLHVAVKHSQERIAKLLINHGALVNAKDASNHSPIYYAAKNVDMKIMKLLLNNDADVTETPEALNTAVEKGWEKLVKTILAKGAKVNAQDNNGRSALHCTALGEDDRLQSEIAELLLSSGANVNALSSRPNKEPEDLSNIFQKLFLGAKSDRYFSTDASTLHAAVRAGFYRLIEILFQYNADVNIRDSDSETPLHLAAQGSNTLITEMLLKKGADVHAATGGDGNTPLHMAVIQNRTEMIDILVKGGADIGSKNKEGESPLHTAAASPNCEVVSMLIKLGADVDSKNINGQTPLHKASEEGEDKVLSLLLEMGADVNIISKQSETAVEMALSANPAPFGSGNVLHNILFNGLGGLDTDSDNDYDDFDIYNDFYDSDDDYYDYDDDDIDGDLLENALFGCDEDEDTHQICIEILERHVALMRAANMYVHKDLLSEPCSDLTEFSKAYTRELAKMKKTPIGTSSITFYNFLQKTVLQLVECLDNESILSVMQSGSYKQKFPAFARLISNHFHKGVYRRMLIDKVNKNCKLVFPRLPYECVQIVLSFLSNVELVNFGKCLTEPL